MLDDRILIWQFNRRRGEAAHRIYERYKHDLVTLAASLLTDLSLAEDVVPFDIDPARVNPAASNAATKK